MQWNFRRDSARRKDHSVSSITPPRDDQDLILLKKISQVLTRNISNDDPQKPLSVP